MAPGSLSGRRPGRRGAFRQQQHKQQRSFRSSHADNDHCLQPGSRPCREPFRRDPNEQGQLLRCLVAIHLARLRQRRALSNCHPRRVRSTLPPQLSEPATPRVACCIGCTAGLLVSVCPHGDPRVPVDILSRVRRNLDLDPNKLSGLSHDHINIDLHCRLACKLCGFLRERWYMLILSLGGDISGFCRLLLLARCTWHSSRHESWN